MFFCADKADLFTFFMENTKKNIPLQSTKLEIL
jgi:hypothetical protein